MASHADLPPFRARSFSSASSSFVTRHSLEFPIPLLPGNASPRCRFSFLAIIPDIIRALCQFRWMSSSILFLAFSRHAMPAPLCLLSLNHIQVSFVHYAGYYPAFPPISPHSPPKNTLFHAKTHLFHIFFSLFYYFLHLFSTFFHFFLA